MELSLVRVSVAEEGAFGVLVCAGYPFVVTLERTYGEDDRVKIPPGAWPCERTQFFRGNYPTFEIHVPGHSRILFHKGNVEPDSDGCVLVGKSFGRLNGRAAILQSSVGFGEFMNALSGRDEFSLNVRGVAA